MPYTKNEARRISYFGAIKMDDQGYRLKPMIAVTGGFFVHKPAEINGSSACYAVTVRPEFCSCTCPFFAENEVCKHILRVRWEQKDIARIDEEVQIRADAWGEDCSRY